MDFKMPPRRITYTYSLAGVYTVMLVAVLTTQGQAERDHKGTHFVVGFLDTNSTLPPELLIVSQSDVTTNITVHVPGNPRYDTIKRTLHKDEILSIKLDPGVRMRAGTKQRKGIEISSTSDIVVYGENAVSGHTDIFLALPVDTLGEEYYLASYNANRSQHRPQVGIVAVANDTRLNISLPRRGRSLLLDYDGVLYGNGETIELEMAAYDAVQLENDLDLTGLKVSASHPVAVVSGDTLRVESEDGQIWYDHVVEQMVPIQNWGTSFVSMPFSGASSPATDVFQVIASENDTKIAVKGKDSVSLLTLSESEDTHVNATQHDYIAIESDKPVLVLQYLIPDVATLNGGQPKPFMLTVPPTEQGESQYLFSIVSTSQQTVTLVVNSTKTDAVLLDGQHIRLTLNTTSVTWVLIEGAGTHYAAVQLPVKPGFHNLTHIHHSPDSVFNAMSHGYPLGMRFRQQAQHSASDVGSDQTENDVKDDVISDPKSVMVADKSHDIIDDRPPYVRPNKPTGVVGHKHREILENEVIGYKDVDSTGSDVVNKGGNQYKVKVVSKEDRQSNEVNFHQSESYSNGEEGLSSTVIAVIVSLATAVFFVIACIVGFLAAEFVCRRENFPSAKVSPYME